MKVKEVSVTRDDILSIFSIIENELLQNKHAQVFIESSAITELLNKIKKGKTKKNIKVEWRNTNVSIIPAVHFDVHDGPIGYAPVILGGTFEFNTNDFCQLKGLLTKNVNYMSHLVNFEQLLLIRMN